MAIIGVETDDDGCLEFSLKLLKQKPVSSAVVMMHEDGLAQRPNPGINLFVCWNDFDPRELGLPSLEYSGAPISPHREGRKGTVGKPSPGLLNR